MAKKGMVKREVSGILMRNYIIRLVGYLALFYGICILMGIFYFNFVVNSRGIIYEIFRFFIDYALLILFAGTLIVFLYATYISMVKPLEMVDDVVEASKKIAEEDEAPIELPPYMEMVEYRLKAVKDRVIKNREMAEEAVRRKNDLLVYLAHDLKTPLTSIIGYLTLLKDEPDINEATREKYTQIALKKAERLEELINEFFEITRFNLTSMNLDLEKTNLTRMLEQILSESEPSLMEHGLKVESEIRDNVDILCDRDKLSRAFENLVRNAVNYSYRGSIIRIKMSIVGNTAELVFENRGRTIAPEKLNHIFERFFRADNSRSSSTGGSGLGLAIAKEIIETHGGTISAASENETNTFTVSLPLKIAS